MAILLMLSWWYGRGWLWVLNSTQKRLKTIGKAFAVKILIQTWFSPWKQIYRPSSFRTFIRDAVDNAVSRGVGAVVRGSILFAALILSIFTVVFGVICLILWPLLPLLVIILPILAASGVSF